MNWVVVVLVIVGLVAYRVSVEPERKARDAQLIEQLARNSAERAYAEAVNHGARDREAMQEARRAYARTNATLNPAPNPPPSTPPQPHATNPTMNIGERLRACEAEMTAEIRAREAAGKIVDGASALAQCPRIINLKGRDRFSAVPLAVTNATQGTLGNFLFGK